MIFFLMKNLHGSDSTFFRVHFFPQLHQLALHCLDIVLNLRGKTNEKLEHRGHTGASFRGETIKLRLLLNCHQLLTTLTTTKDITRNSLILLHLVQLVLQLLNVVLNLGSWTDNTSADMILFVERTQQKRPIRIY